MLKPHPIFRRSVWREVEGQQEHVRDALVAFALEMVLGQPERVVPAPVEQARQVARLGEGGDEVLVRKHAAVHGDAAVADVVHIHVAGVEAVELGDHGPFLPFAVRRRRRRASRRAAVSRSAPRG